MQIKQHGSFFFIFKYIPRADCAKCVRIILSEWDPRTVATIADSILARREHPDT